MKIILPKFTFYYSYIKTETLAGVGFRGIYLHSTIVILRHVQEEINNKLDENLHSTIVILRHTVPQKICRSPKFTFYYSYIKTLL